jgi:hypothetical protein
VAYIIFNSKIMSGTGGTHTPWKWRDYTGESPHTKHMHVSIKRTAAADSDVRSWLGGTPLLGAAVPVKGWDEMATRSRRPSARSSGRSWGSWFEATLAPRTAGRTPTTCGTSTGP